MRNLKKFLALVLAMMMVFGLMVTANAADVDYSDLDEVTYEYDESVKVTTALGVWRGRDGNNFAPQASIQRNEFATVLYRLATGDVKDEHLSDWAGKAVFNDVPADNWAAPYVAYAHSMGLMIGYNGNFSPDVNIDGHDAALALLRLLGYGKKGEYTGTDYKLNVAIDAATLGVSRYVGTRNLTGYATREIVAGLAYGALRSTKAYYNSDGGEYINESRGNSSLGYIVFDMEVIHDGQWISGTGQNAVYWDLDNDFDLEGDPFGRPVTYVVLVHDKVIYEGIPAPIATYNSTFTGKNARFTAADAKTSLTVYYNGTKEPDSTAGNLFWGKTVADTGTSYGSVITPGAINHPLWHDYNTAVKGVEVEVYEDGAYNYTVVAREAYLAYVEELDDLDDNIVVTVYTADTSYVEDEFEIKDDKDDDDDLYDWLLDYQGEYIAVYPKMDRTKGGEITSIIGFEPLDTEDVDVNRTDKDKTYKHLGTVTADGTVYSVSREAVLTKDSGINFDWENDNVFDPNAGILLTDTVLYLHNGNILMVDQTDSEAANRAGYAYLYDVKNNNGVWVSEDGFSSVRMYLADGTKVEVEAKDKTPGADRPIYNFVTGNLYGAKGNNSVGVLVYYTISSKGVYTLSEITTTEAGATNGDLEIKPNSATNKVPVAGNSSGETMKFNNDTVFFVVRTKYNSDTAMKEVVSVDTYKGIGNVPKLDAKTSGTWVAAAKATGPNNNTGVIANSTNDVVTALMVENPENVNTANYFIVINPNAKRVKETVDNVQLDYFEFNAIVDGKETKVKVDAQYAIQQNQDATSGNLAMGVQYLGSVTTDDYGIITLYSETVSSIVSANTKLTLDSGNSTVAVNKAKGIITLNTTDYKITNDLSVYLYDSKGGVKKVSVSKVHTDTKSTQYYGYVVEDANGALILTELYVMDGWNS